jgi:hypothetical protein
LAPALPPATVGTLGEGTMRTLLATANAVIDMPVEASHYQDYFRWRSENVPGYKGVYEQFAAALDTAAKQSAGKRFAEVGGIVQREILAKLLQVVNPSAGDLGKVWVGLFDRQWLLYDRYVIREVFDLFARTDAWVKLGYETWPGQHRGLYAYTQPPTAASDATCIRGDDSSGRAIHE